MTKTQEQVLVTHSLPVLLLDFLHDVIAANYTAGKEIDLKAENYKRLAEWYASVIDLKYLKENNVKVLRK